MSENNLPVVPNGPPHMESTVINPKTRKCGACGLEGHNKRRCPSVLQTGEFYIFFVHHDDDGSNFFGFSSFHLYEGSNPITKHKSKQKADSIAVIGTVEEATTIPTEPQNQERFSTTTATTQDTFITPPTRQQIEKFNISECIYIVFDLETTGRSPDRHNITEIACELVNCSGSIIADTKFSSPGPYRNILLD